MLRSAMAMPLIGPAPLRSAAMCTDLCSLGPLHAYMLRLSRTVRCSGTCKHALRT